jgi:hypothetical protein
MNFGNKQAWKEAFLDTGIGFVVNFPLNIVLLSIAVWLNLSVLWTSIWMSVAFTVVAIVRKYIVREYFSKKNSCQ